MHDKVDFKKTLDSYQALRGHFRLVEVPELRYLMIDGRGDPNTTAEYTEAVETLYPIAYKLKFASKRELGRDYVVPPLEGLWWAEDIATFTSLRDKSQWEWTMMLMLPEWIDTSLIDVTIALLASKGESSRFGKVRVEHLVEGLCVQTLHVGAFDDEGPVIEQMHNSFAPENDLQLRGKHHEIYLSDFRRTAPEKLRTILRQPVSKLK